MAALSDLPNELLEHIFSFITNKCALCLISTVSRQFHGILRGLIVRNIRALYQYPRLVAKLIRALKENPALQTLVLRLDVLFYDRNAEKRDAANELLSLLPNLRYLSVCSYAGGPACAPFLPHFPEVNKMVNLRHVDIFDHHITMKKLNGYMALPCLDTLKVISYYQDIPQNPESFANENFTKSTVRSLEFDPRSHLPSSILQEVINWCPKLKSLRCAIPIRAQIDEENISRRRHITEPLCPSKISEILFTAKDTMEELHFTESDLKWDDIIHDNSKLDLSNMRVLRKLSCSARCFFPPVRHPTQQNRTGFWTLLPLSLEHLSIDFSASSPFAHNPAYFKCLQACSRPANPELFYQITNASDTSSFYAWLDELAEYKISSRAALRLVQLQDPDLSWGSFQGKGNWTPPAQLATRFQEAGIKIEACVYDGSDVKIPKPGQIRKNPFSFPMGRIKGCGEQCKIHGPM